MRAAKGIYMIYAISKDHKSIAQRRKGSQVSPTDFTLSRLPLACINKGEREKQGR